MNDTVAVIESPIKSKTVQKKTSTQTFTQFIKEYNNKDKSSKPTHTRIGNTDLSIYGGSYCIPDDKHDTFYTLYAKEIKGGKIPEYFTETQLETGGPILVDIDLRFDLTVVQRLYTEQHVEDVKNLYLEELKNMYQFDEQPFYLYLFEKTKVNPVQEKKVTKDGIHMVIGIQSKREEQTYLRNRIIEQMPELWNDLPLVNTWEEVFDQGITTGKTNWQLFGSTKPGYEPYKLTKQYKVTFDPSDGDFTIENVTVPTVIHADLLKDVSARCGTHPRYFLKSECLAEITGQAQQAQRQHVSAHVNQIMNHHSSNNLEVLKIKNRDMLNDYVAVFLENIETTNYPLRETYDYTMGLPEKYYGTGSYPHWIKVGWALRNISDILFVVWVELSAKWEHFDFNCITEMYERWIAFDVGNSNGLTRRSIMHWLKQDNFAEYTKVRNQSIEYHINESLKNPKCGDVDIANVLYEFYKDQYVCTSIKGDIWYRFSEHRWRMDERGTSLRQHISDELRQVYIRLATEKKQKTISASDEEKEKMAPFISKIQEVIRKLGQTTEKDHIMKEAKEKFYDKGGVFMNRLDTNPYILCLTNGVVDFKEKIFRDGRPEDCVSKCTNIKYIVLDESNPTPAQQQIMDEINDFMRKLFPIPDVYNYMWEHLASTLIGTSVNQTFHMYIGKGRNGKSVLMDLMTKTLGDYKGDVPLSIITASRTKPGGLNPELVELKGVRYAVMQEPSPDEKINVGPMKMLTGGKDVIQCRAPYMPEMVRYTPQFKLCLCTNTLMKINSLDDGTWRRIRVVDFVSLFTENPVQGDEDKPYQYKVEEIDEKFDSWKEIFLSMLVNVVKKTNGVVKLCDRVMQSSNAYKGEQDYIGVFIQDKIVADPMGRIHSSQLKVEFEKWYASMYDERTKPKPKDVYDYFDKKYGKRQTNQPWKGISLVREQYTDDEAENSECNVDDEDFSSS
jgi:P4 family phage/plasmid primase-like protien